jgi:hypothetical protein
MTDEENIIIYLAQELQSRNADDRYVFLITKKLPAFILQTVELQGNEEVVARSIVAFIKDNAPEYMENLKPLQKKENL